MTSNGSTRNNISRKDSNNRPLHGAPAVAASWLALASAALALSAVTIARADEFSRNSAPHRWVEKTLPEKLPALKYPKYYRDLDKARALAFAGRYRQALAQLSTVAKGDPAEIATIRGMCLRVTGDRDAALKVLTDPDIANNVRVLVERARVLEDLGRTNDAAALLKEAADKNPESILARFNFGMISEATGDMSTARQQYQWIHDKYWDKWTQEGPAAFEDAEEVTLMGRGLDRHFTLQMGYQSIPGLENIILKIFTQAYDIIDTQYWPAHLAAAEYLVARDNEKDAVAELKAVGQQNPADIRTLQLLGEMALGKYDFDRTEACIEFMRDVDPQCPAAAVLEVRDLLQQRRAKDALAVASQLVEKRPQDVEILSLKAACYALQLNDKAVRGILDQIESMDKNNASAYYEVASQLGAMRQYVRAADMYKIAVERAPWLTDARNGLGLLYTQWGEESKAREVLEAASVLDPYNRRTHNYLILLDQTAKMPKLVSSKGNFIISADPAEAPILSQYMADYLETIHADVCRHFEVDKLFGKLALPETTTIQVFPRHDEFSVRTTGTPWIGTVGAAMGKNIAMVSPRNAANTFGTYNWATVLRHEYTHTITLAITDNRIAHWMTEGLAVEEERNPIRWEWVPMLLQAVRKHELFTMDQLTWAFVRPKRPQDRTLAYAESAWICEYIEEKWDHDHIQRMLAGFREGKEQDQVFQEVLGQNLDDFAKDFFKWCDARVATWGYDPKTSATVAGLRSAAEILITDRKYKEAVPIWEKIVALRPVDALPHQRLAFLYMQDECKDTPKAIEHLLRLHQVSLKDNAYAKRIARLYRDEGDLANAGRYALESIYISPFDAEAHDLRLEIARLANDKPAVEREEKVIPLLTDLLAKWRAETQIPN